MRQLLTEHSIINAFCYVHKQSVPNNLLSNLSYIKQHPLLSNSLNKSNCLTYCRRVFIIISSIPDTALQEKINNKVKKQQQQ